MPDSDHLIPFLVILLPAAWALLSGLLSLRFDGPARATDWILSQEQRQVLTVLTVPVWLSLRAHEALYISGSLKLVVLPFALAILFADFIGNSFSRNILGLRWSQLDLIRLSLWNTLSFPVPFLACFIAFEALNDGSIAGIVLLICAGFTALISRGCSRWAEGIHLRQVKSGELYKRALGISKKMGVRLDRICVVPYGRGHLSNAFGGLNVIAITDDYGHWLHGAQLDFVIGHEVAHVQRKHALKKLVGVAATAAGLAVLAFILPVVPVARRFPVRFALAIVPLLVYFFVSRQCEFAADRLAVEATGQPEMAIQALVSLYEYKGTPPKHVIIEMFSTHPGLQRRTARIAAMSRASDVHTG